MKPAAPGAANGSGASAMRILESRDAPIASMPPDPRHVYELAQASIGRGNYSAALAALEEGLANAPEDAALLFARATCLAMLARHEAAVPAFNEALKRAPGSYLAGLGLAQALANVGDFEGSERQYRLLAKAAPHSPDPPAGLAQLAVKRGDPDTAIKLTTSVLASTAGHPVALQALTEAALLKQRYPYAEELARALIATNLKDGPDSALGWVRLGDALHGQSRFDEAFEAYTRGKSQTSKQFEGEFGGARESVAMQAERLLREAGPLDFGNPVDEEPAAGDERRAPVHGFILGFPRSGTTLLEEILAAHPNTVSLDERATLALSETSFIMEKGGLEVLAGIDAETARVHRQAYWRVVDNFAADRGKSAVIDKMPLRSMSLPIIAKLFPDARVLLCVRDPRDVVLSCFRRSFAINRTTYEFTGLERTARCYDAVMRLISAYRSKLKLNLSVIRHEALVDDFSGEVSKILTFMDLDWSEAVSNFASSAKRRPIRTPSANHIRQGLDPKTIGQWTAYERELGPVLPILKPWIETWGYEL